MSLKSIIDTISFVKNTREELTRQEGRFQRNLKHAAELRSLHRNNITEDNLNKEDMDLYQKYTYWEREADDANIRIEICKKHLVNARPIFLTDDEVSDLEKNLDDVKMLERENARILAYMIEAKHAILINKIKGIFKDHYVTPFHW